MESTIILVFNFVNLLFFAILSDSLKASADGRKGTVKCRSFVLRKGTADRIKDGADFLRNPFAGLLTFFSQEQRASVPFSPPGIPDDKSVTFQIDVYKRQSHSCTVHRCFRCDFTPYTTLPYHLSLIHS